MYSITYFDDDVDPNVPVNMIWSLKSKDNSSPFDKATNDMEVEDDYVEGSESEDSAPDSSMLEAEVVMKDTEDTAEKDTGGRGVGFYQRKLLMRWPWGRPGRGD